MDKTTAGGDFIDLGGFDNIIHGHDTDLKLKFKIELTEIKESYFKDLSLIIHENAEGDEFYDNLYNNGNKYMELTIAKKDDDIIVESINILINNYISLTIFAKDSRLEALDISGEVTNNFPSNIDDIITFRSLFPGSSSFNIENGNSVYFYSMNEGIVESDYKSSELNFLVYFVKRQTLLPDVSKYIQEPIKRGWEYDDFVSAAFETALYGMIGTVVDELKSMLYLGPLRSIPPRNYLPQRITNHSRWANGLAAWDKASYADQHKIDELNFWMGDSRLNTGYQLQTNYFYRLPANTIKTAKKLQGILDKLPAQEGTVDLVQEDGLKVSLYDVGVGISQIFPVVVAALDEEARFSIIEQPELHIHPRLQVELGDLFIKAIQKDKCMIIETHSEHLLLRIMRRIREYETSLKNESTSTAPGNAESRITAGDVGVWFLERYNGKPIAREMALNKHGELVKSWPGGFFEEGLRETI